MANNLGFVLNRSGGRELLHDNARLKSIMEDVAQKKLSMAQAQFVSDFGTEGKFEIAHMQNQNRMFFRIKAADAKTATILKANPKWLDKVTSGVTF